jgi:RNA polymerase sigma-70 factor (ECF subfamily)
MDPRTAELWSRHGAIVLRRAQQILGNAQDAEEAAQEVFLRAANALATLEARAQMTTWLYRVTTNLCLNRLRDLRRRAALESRHEAALRPSGSAVDPVKLLALRRLLAEADPAQAEAAVLVFVDGLSHAEAAEVLGVSRRTVGNLCERFVVWGRERLSASP